MNLEDKAWEVLRRSQVATSDFMGNVRVRPITFVEQFVAAVKQAIEEDRKTRHE